MRFRRGLRPFASARRPWLFAAWLIPCTLWCVALAPGAPITDRQSLPASPAQPVQDSPYTAIVRDTEESTHLLKRAREAIDRNDFKLAIDSLQRVIEMPGDAVLQTEPGLYESARWHAHRMVAALPPEGLAAYRLLHDGAAKALFEQAVATHDERPLRQIAAQYLLTRYGDDAVATLCGWLLDDGKAASALSLLHDLQAVYPDADVPSALLDGEAAVAEAMLGRTNQADERAKPLAATAAHDERYARFADAVHALVAAPGPDRAGVEPVRWPVPDGQLDRQRRMPLVEPTLIDRSVWNVPLLDDLTIPLHDIDRWQHESRAMPVAMPVTDGRIMVVKQDDAITAVDLDTFAVRWQVRDSVQSRRLLERFHAEQRARMMRSAAFASRREGSLLDELVGGRRLFSDQIAAGVSIGHGCAFAIERSAQSMIWLARLAEEDESFAWMTADDVQISDRLVAYDMATGDVRWARGQNDESDDPLGNVEFMAAPTPVGPHLLVPYRDGTDLYAAVLDPASGTLVHRIHLCGLPAAGVDSLHALDPAVGDDVAYIPTNRGLLMAVDLTTTSIRWARQYPQNLTAPDQRHPSPRRNRAVGWDDTTPIVARDLVLLPPADADQLYAFRCMDGEIVWSIPRGQHRYVIGADDRHVWLGGPEVAMVEVATGQVVWSHVVDAQTGRGVCSGDRLYLPTQDALIALDATTGRELEQQPIPSQQRCLGNLLCLQGSLYSVDIASLRRYPDMVRTYDRALAAHERDPSDAAAAIRLSWMELLRDQPSQTLVTLDSVPPDQAEHGPYADEIAHIRTEALLALVRTPGMVDDRAQKLLDVARRIARRPADQARAGLALGEQLDKTGQYAAAYRTYAELVLGQGIAGGASDPSEALDSVFLPSSPGVQQPAWRVAAARLPSLEQHLATEQQHALQQWVSGRLEAAIDEPPDAHSRIVERIASAAFPQTVRDRARLQLADWARADERFEEAEYHYRRLIEQTDSRETRAAALVGLALIYVQPDELHMPAAANECIGELSATLADVPVRAREITGSEDATVTGAQAAAWLLARVDAAQLARDEAALRGPVLGEIERVDYVASHPDAALLELPPPLPEPLVSQLLLLAGDTELRAHAIADGALLWPAMLRLLGEPTPAVEVTPMPRMVVQVGTDPETQATLMFRPRAVSDGQVLVLNSERALHAVGMATGLRLWSRPFLPNGRSVTASNAYIWADRGRLVTLDGRGELTMTSTVDGQAVRWRRQTANQQWKAVRLRGDYVVAVDDDVANATIFHADDGRLLGQAVFPANEGRRLGVTLFDEVICGPLQESTVGAMELAAPGVERWRVLCQRDGQPLTVTGLFKPRPQQLAIGCRGGLILVIDPTTGRTIQRYDTGMPDVSVFEGTITDDVFCLYAARPEPAGAFVVIGLDARDGRRLWTYEPRGGEFWSQYGYAYPMDSSLLSASRNAIPIARLQQRMGQSARSRGNPQQPENNWLELTILDKRTGQPIGAPKTIRLGSGEEMATIDQVLVRPGRVIIVGGATHVVFSVDWPEQVATKQVS